MVRSDAAHMRQALEAATVGLARRAGPFGAVVVSDGGGVLSVGVNLVLVNGDPTAHAEVVAIRRAVAVRGTPTLAGCTLFCTCAPCVMCTGAIHWARIGRVVAAARAADAEALGFVEGPPGFDAAAALRALGVAYEADVERDGAVTLLQRYRGPVY
jgi:guanine deaminase